MRYDATGVDASGGFPLIEDERFLPFRIVTATPGKSKGGDFQVTVDAVCLDPRWRDYNVRHWITFVPKENKGAGIALHFLKCIGEEHEGVITIEPMNWERKTFMARVIVSSYEGKKNNKFAEISPLQKTDAEIPFGAPADEADPFAEETYKKR